MFLRLGVYQDLCREHEHAKLSLWILKRARKQSSFPQWWESIVSLPEVVRYPPPAVSCRTPTQRAPWRDRLWQLLSPTWPGLVRLLCALLSSCCKGTSTGASPWQVQRLHRPWETWFLQPAKYPSSQSRQKYLTSIQAEYQSLSWETLRFSEMRNNMEFHSFLKGSHCIK